jgi:hypothetical protein
MQILSRLKSERVKRGGCVFYDGHEQALEAKCRQHAEVKEMFRSLSGHGNRTIGPIA